VFFILGIVHFIAYEPIVFLFSQEQKYTAIFKKVVLYILHTVLSLELFGNNYILLLEADIHQAASP
jgi:hypothetical protein